MREMSDDYLAGFFDGEGHVSILRSRCGTTANVRYWLRVGVSNTDPVVIMEFKKRFGGSVHLRPSRSIKHTPCYDWVGQNRTAEKCLLILFPHLLVKQRDAQLGLEFQNVVRQGNSGSWGRKLLTNEEHLERDAVRLKLIEKHGLASRAVI